MSMPCSSMWSTEQFTLAAVNMLVLSRPPVGASYYPVTLPSLLAVGKLTATKLTFSF